MLFLNSNIDIDEVKTISSFLDEIETTNAEDTDISLITQYITSLVSTEYQKSVEKIEQTQVGNKIVRKRGLQQIMKESFFYGSNRFGNNFIA